MSGQKLKPYADGLLRQTPISATRHDALTILPRNPPGRRTRENKAIKIQGNGQNEKTNLREQLNEKYSILITKEDFIMFTKTYKPVTTNNKRIIIK